MSKKLTIDEINKRLGIAGKKIKVIDTEYGGKDTPVKCLCLICGKEFYMTYSTMRNSEACQECGYEKGRLKRSLTIEKARQQLFELNPTIEITSTEYKNTNTDLHYRCTVCGYEWDRTFSRMKQNPTCHKCNVKNKIQKFTIEEIRDQVRLISPNIEILSNEYKGSNEKLLCRCLIDNHTWEAKCSSIKRGSGCPECKKRKTRDALMFTLDQIKSKLNTLNKNIEITSEEYLGVDEKLDCSCNVCGHKWTTTWHILAHGSHNCPKCAREKLKNTFEYVSDQIKIIHPYAELLSTKYINSTSKLDMHCTIDDNYWSASWDTLSRGKGCPVCGLKRRSGSNNPNWNGGTTALREALRFAIIPWKKDSIKDCNYRCVITGKRFGAVHHLYGYDLILEETLKIENLPIYENIGDYTNEEMERLRKTCLELHYKYGLGICLTTKMHKKFHTLYDYGKNTPDQFDGFLNILESEKFYDTY